MMSLVTKLWPGKRPAVKEPQTRQSVPPDSKSKPEQQPATAAPAAQAQDKKCLRFGTSPIRILLLREFETRDRMLLFDSMVVENGSRRNTLNNESNNNNGLSVCRNTKSLAQEQHIQTTRKSSDSTNCELEKQQGEELKLLGEMIFGSVAMKYKGPLFKIHVVDSPPCIMCTKVFPSSVQGVCRPSERHSSEALGTSTNLESNSSNSSLRNQISRPGSGNLSSNSLSPTIRKNSTCSSIGSGWDIDVPRFNSSQQSLDGNGMSTNGSLTSLRRRWQRAVSTSLSRSESDDGFNHGTEVSLVDSTTDLQGRRRNTRLGLVLLVQLPAGREREMTNILLEHAALLEGMLDRLRYSCTACQGPRQKLIKRLYCAANSSTLRLLKLLMKLESEATKPLLWHNLLLNSTQPIDVQVNTIHRTMQQMCWLLEKFDTKSTNFFISTIVTAVLTHHLGWVHTAPPYRNRQLIERISQQYSCNPLWAQLTDLYGAFGNPSRIAHTVIVGEPEKVNLIESVLHFLSYFIRSGLVEKQKEIRCPDQEDVQEAIASLERALRNNPSLEQPSPLDWNFSEAGKRSLKSSTRRTKLLAQESPSSKTDPTTNGDATRLQIPGASPKDGSSLAEDATRSNKLKRSGTLHSQLNEFASKPLPPPPLPTTESQQQPRKEPVERQATSKVKIIVSHEDERKLCSLNNKTPNPEPPQLPDFEPTGLDSKQLSILERQKLPAFGSYPSNAKTFEEQSLAFASMSFDEDASREVKTQVYFTLGGEEKPSLSIRERLKSSRKCQCSYTFTRVPSTSAELPEGVLRKIIQRNFPESSKNMTLPAGSEDGLNMCLKCRRGYADSSQRFEKLLLETPTNATEVLRSCGTSASCEKLPRSDSLEALLEANGIVEVPMPRSQKVSSAPGKKSREPAGFSESLIGLNVQNPQAPEDPESTNYTWGMVIQGMTKKKNKQVQSQQRRGGNRDERQSTPEREKSEAKDEQWWRAIREGLGVEVKFPLLDQPVSEALCILGDLDSWQVSLLSSLSTGSTPMSVGMSRLVSDMLEAFVYLWKHFHSPEQCIKLLESRLREMWLRSETLAEFLMTADLDDVSIGNLTDFLDVDVADLPLLLAVASTHSPQITQRFGLTLT